MVKRIFCALLVLAGLSLCACSKEAAAPLPSATVPIPSSPHHSTDTTPQDQIQTAMDKTFATDGCTFTYGTRWKGEEDLTTGQGSQAHQALRTLIPNEALVEDFCRYRLMATPGTDGSLTHQVTELTLEETYRLIYGKDPDQPLLPEAYSDALGTVSFHTDSQGFFTELRIDVDLYTDTHRPTATWSLIIQIVPGE